MLTDFIEFFKKDRLAKILGILFIVFTFLWIFFADVEIVYGMTWGYFYNVIAIISGIYGLVIAWRWGALGSVMGRSIIAFSFGLLFQVIGQNIFAYYILISGIDIPYPSLADVGFFGSIPFYIYGIILLARASGATVSLKSFTNQVQAVLIPIAGLTLSYYLFLRNYEFDWSEPLRVLLDFGYPLGQAAYITIALAAFLISRKVLGGIMKNKIMFVLLALLIQYAADYNFLYQAYNETWINGRYGDVIYMLAYLVMGLGLLQLDVKYVSPRLTSEAQTDTGERLWKQLDQVATVIVEGQAVIIGPLAWNEAGQVSGVAMDMTQRKIYLVGNNPGVILENLTIRYERLFGRASIEVSRDAVHKFTSQIPQEQIPEILR